MLEALDCLFSKGNTSSRFARIPRERTRASRSCGGTAVDAAQTFMKPRLAYRDVASSTNRLSLIAAIVPAGVVTRIRCSAENASFRRQPGVPLRDAQRFVANYWCAKS